MDWKGYRYSIIGKTVEGRVWVGAQVAVPLISSTSSQKQYFCWSSIEQNLFVTWNRWKAWRKVVGQQEDHKKNREIPRDPPCPPHPIPRKKENHERRRCLDFRLRKDLSLNLISSLTWTNHQTVLHGFSPLSNGNILQTVALRAVWELYEVLFHLFLTSPKGRYSYNHPCMAHDITEL